jgi:trans-aconitate methyltransferase
MNAWIWIFIIFAGGLFGLKVLYVISIAVVLPKTQGALFVSTSRRKITALLKAIPMQPGQVLLDLGCGDGRVLRQAHRRYGVMSIGYELNPLAYLKARMLCLGKDQIRVNRQNFFAADLSSANVVFCYLFPDVMPKLARKLKQNLKEGTIVISANFRLPGFRAYNILRLPDLLHNDPIYFYRIEKSAP